MFKGTKYYEGLRLHVYTDTTGHSTIGYGHNLDASNRHLFVLGFSGADVHNLIDGILDLTQTQADNLFVLDRDDAVVGVKSLGLPYLKFPEIVQEILVDLVIHFNNKEKNLEKI